MELFLLASMVFGAGDALKINYIATACGAMVFYPYIIVCFMEILIIHFSYIPT